MGRRRGADAVAAGGQAREAHAAAGDAHLLKRDHSPPPQREIDSVRAPRGRRVMVATARALDETDDVLWTAPQRRSRFAGPPAMVMPPRAVGRAGAVAATASTTIASGARAAPEPLPERSLETDVTKTG